MILNPVQRYYATKSKKRMKKHMKKTNEELLKNYLKMEIQSKKSVESLA